MPSMNDAAPERLANSPHTRSSLPARFARLIRRNPSMLATVLRMDYRNRLGSRIDQRLHPGRSAAPCRISVPLTRRCNLRCRMCVQNRHGDADTSLPSWYDPDLEMPLRRWTPVLDQLRPFRPWISVTGGEPLLHGEFRRFVSEVKGRKLPVDVTTNGLLLERHARFIVDSGVEIVYVSLDGPETVHDRIRGLEGAFRSTLDGLRALVEARSAGGWGGPIIAVNCTISRSNIRLLERMVPIAAESGADLLQFIHAMFDTPENVARHNAVLCGEWAREHGIDLLPPSKPEGEYYESEIGEADIPVLRESLAKARQRAEHVVNLKVLPDLDPGLLAPYYLDMDYPFAAGCRALWTLCTILPDGTVSPCHHVIAGNVQDAPFLEIWNGRTMSRYREAALGGLFPSCARCCRRSFMPKPGASVVPVGAVPPSETLWPGISRPAEGSRTVGSPRRSGGGQGGDPAP